MRERQRRMGHTRYQHWLERYNNPAIYTRRRCAPGYVC